MADKTTHCEETLNRRVVFQGRTFGVTVDTVRLPDGRERVREIVRRSNSVVIIAIQDDCVFFVRQFRFAAGSDLLELPAGTLEPGEDAETAARREIQEEIGYRADTMSLLFEGYVSPGYTTEYQFFYLAEGLTKSEAEGDEDEYLERETLPFEEALRRARHGGFEDVKTVAGLLAADAVRRNAL